MTETHLSKWSYAAQTRGWLRPIISVNSSLHFSILHPGTALGLMLCALWRASCKELSTLNQLNTSQDQTPTKYLDQSCIDSSISKLPFLPIQFQCISFKGPITFLRSKGTSYCSLVARHSGLRQELLVLIYYSLEKENCVYLSQRHNPAMLLLPLTQADHGYCFYSILKCPLKIPAGSIFIEWIHVF